MTWRERGRYCHLVARDQDVSEAVARAVDAVVAKLEAPRRMRGEIWALKHDHGLSVPEITRVLYEGLRARGLSPEQIDGAGVSHDSVRLAVRGPRP